MGGVGEFAGEILSGKVQILVHIQPPFGTVGHIIDDAFVGDEFSCATFAGIPAEFHFGDDALGGVHGLIINKKSPVTTGDFFSGVNGLPLVR